MIRIKKSLDVLLFEYQPDFGAAWIEEKFSANEPIVLKNTYVFYRDDLIVENDIDEAYESEKFTFQFGILENDYYKIDSDVLSINFNLYFHKSIDLTDEMFVAYRKISIFGHINRLLSNDVFIGVDSGNLPFVEFQKLLLTFPNSYETTKYANARISSILRNYFDLKSNSVEQYNTLINRKQIYQNDLSLMKMFSQNEYAKYFYILQTLKEMLNNEVNYSEKQWQRCILEIIQLVYPKYIRVFEEVDIIDMYSRKYRRLDYLLVDSNGNTDVIEIKKPFNDSIVTQGKYRDNYIPLRELSGTVMQIEKYIFCLSKWGRSGEELLTQKYGSCLPSNFSIKITNPSGIIIMGRENNLSIEQKDDFEVIKRKYKNIVDIVTYDELLSRLEHILYKFSDDIKL